ncbi:hypothetical protein, partial [Nocardia sp. NPDC024068]|uniref:hypothetical protein n=1 Tax=Nocardia sp. NPDC024068 TaxID=3157197 RepID=UPI0033E9DB55
MTLLVKVGWVTLLVKVGWVTLLVKVGWVTLLVKVGQVALLVKVLCLLARWRARGSALLASAVSPRDSWLRHVRFEGCEVAVHFGFGERGFA